MNDEHIQRTAYLYGRNIEKLKLIEADADLKLIWNTMRCVSHYGANCKITALSRKMAH